MERGGVELLFFKIIISLDIPFTYRSPLGKRKKDFFDESSSNIIYIKYLSSHVVCKLSLWGLEYFSIMRKKCKVNSLVQSFAIDCSSEWIYGHCGQIITYKIFDFFFFCPLMLRKRTFIIAFWKRNQISSDKSTFFLKNEKIG